jgi:hypothetical protein
MNTFFEQFLAHHAHLPAPFGDAPPAPPGQSRPT